MTTQGKPDIFEITKGDPFNDLHYVHGGAEPGEWVTAVCGHSFWFRPRQAPPLAGGGNGRSTVCPVCALFYSALAGDRR